VALGIVGHEKVGEDRQRLLATLNTASLALDEVFHAFVKLGDPGVFGRVDVFRAELVKGVDAAQQVSGWVRRDD